MRYYWFRIWLVIIWSSLSLGLQTTNTPAVNAQVADKLPACRPSQDGQEFNALQALRSLGATFNLPLKTATDNVRLNLQFQPKPAHASFRHGLELYAKGDAKGAVEAFLQAIEEDTDYTIAYYNLWKSLDRLSKEERLSLQAKILSRLENSAARNNGHYYWLQILFSQSEAKDATSAQQTVQKAEQKRLVEKALALNPNFAPGNYELAKLLDQEGLSAEAEKHLRLAMLAANNFSLPYEYFLSRPGFSVRSAQLSNFLEESRARPPSYYLKDDPDSPFGGEQIYRVAAVYMLYSLQYASKEFLENNDKEVLAWSQKLLDNYPSSYWANYARFLKMFVYIKSYDIEQANLVAIELNQKLASFNGTIPYDFALVLLLPSVLNNNTSAVTTLFQLVFSQTPLNFEYSQQVFVLTVFFQLEKLTQQNQLGAELLNTYGAFALNYENYQQALESFATIYKNALQTKNETERMMATNNLAVLSLIGFNNREMAINFLRETVRYGLNFDSKNTTLDYDKTLQIKAFSQITGWLLKLQDYECSFSLATYLLNLLEQLPQADKTMTPIQLTLHLELGKFWLALGYLEQAEQALQKGQKFADDAALNNPQSLELIVLLSKITLQRVADSSLTQPAAISQTQANLVKIAHLYSSQVDSLSLDYHNSIQTLLGDSYLLLAKLALIQGETAEVRRYLDSAREVYPLDSRTEVKKLERVEILEMQTDITEKAGQYLEQLSVLTQLINFTLETSQSDVADYRSLAYYYYRRGLVYENYAHFSPNNADTDFLQQAESDYRQAVKYLNGLFGSSIELADLRQQFYLDNDQIYEQLVGLLMSKNNPAATAEAFELVEKFRTLPLNPATRKKSVATLTGEEAVQIKELLRLEEKIAIRNLARNSAFNVDKALSDNTQFKKEYAEYEQMLLTIKSRYPQLSRQIGLGAANIEEVQGVLPANTKVIYYYTTSQLTYVWLITQSQIKAYTLQIAPGELAKQVRFLRSGLQPQNADNIGGVKTTAAKLYDSLVKPIATELKPGEHLVISANGLLNYLPFQTLYNSATNHYWIEDYTISYTPSLVELLVILERAKTGQDQSPIMQGQALVVIDPDGSLKEFETEDKAVAKLYGAEVLQGKQATLDDVVKKLENKQVLHISTHGNLVSEAPALSHLKMALANEAAELQDQQLTAFKLDRVNLRDTKLVVLSACNTIPPENVTTGSEVNNLNLSFLRGGSASVVFSLWEVKAKQAGQLLLLFHQHLVNGESKATALQKAQVAIMRQYPAPYYWAAFNLVGDYGPLNLSRTTNIPSNAPETPSVDWFGWVLLVSGLVGLLVIAGWKLMLMRKL